MQLGAAVEPSSSTWTTGNQPSSRRRSGSSRSCLPGYLAVALCVALSGCGEKPAPQAAAPVYPVTVAQPTRRTVTDWDEFTGRFEAVEEVQVRARVGGFVTSVEFRDGAFVKAGDLLYTIAPLPFEAIPAQ